MINSTFWLFASFVVFIALSYKSVLKVVVGKITVYSNDIKEKLFFSENQKNQAENLIKQLQKNTIDIKESCDRIHESTLMQIETLKEKAKNHITSYILFKENYINDKLEIYIREKISFLKLKLIDNSIEISYKYLNDSCFNTPSIKTNSLKVALPVIKNIK